MQRLLRGWYTLTLPKIEQTTPAGREKMRYARLLSGFLLFILALAVLALPLRLVAQDVNGNIIGLFVDGLYLLALLCNKKGWIVPAGILFVLGIFLTEITPLLAQTTGFDTQNLPLFDYLVIAILIAGAVLPPASMFLVAAINSTVIILVILFAPRMASFTQVLQASTVYAVLIPPIFLQIVVAGVMYVIIRYLRSTLKRADRAEQLAELQKQVATFEKARADEKRALEHSIQTIAHTHALVANGDLEARVPLQEQNVLWPVAVPLNNLLSRAQGWKKQAELFAHTQNIAPHIAHYMQVQRSTHQPISFQQLTGTPLDPVLQEINALHQESNTLSSHR